VPLSIEDLILQHDRRGIGALKPFLPPGFCTQAARFLQEHVTHGGAVLICTGFYIPGPNQPETDGPPGAIAIGRAVAALGGRPVYVTDRHALPLLAQEREGNATVLEFPIAGDRESIHFALRLVETVRPSLLVSVERPGLTAAGRYLTMRGVDITSFTARLDALFAEVLSLPSVGIGDGGNEIGMGNLAEHIPSIPTLPPEPTVTRVSSLVIAGVSNWGAYGLLAGLSRETGRDLLPGSEEQEGLVRGMVAAGAVDGVTGRREPTVDSFSLEENLVVLEALRLAAFT